MKRILCIVDAMNTGGAETFLMKLYRALDKSSYQMDFIASDKGFYDKEIACLGGRVFLIPMRTKDFIGAMNGIRKIVHRGKYQCVLKLGSTPIVALDLLAAKIGGAKILAVRSCNAYAEDNCLYRLLNGLLRPLFNCLTDVRIAPSDLAGEFTFGQKAVEKGDVFFLHNAIDLKQFTYDEEKRHELKLSLNIQGKKVFGHIGRFSNQKNHDFLIEIFDRIHLREANSVLVLVGTGSLESAIRQKVKEKGLDDAVLFLGIRDDIPKLLSMMDVFVFPSFYEGMPNTVIEAQATGLRCVVSDTITKQADITGLVTYMSLQDSAASWAEQCIKASDSARVDTHELFMKNRYAIDDVAKDFTSILFGDC